jgi:hypothetical protein
MSADPFDQRPFVARKRQPPGWDPTSGATDGGVFCEHLDAAAFVYVRVRRLDCEGLLYARRRSGAQRLV